ncbi:MAG TPA: EAL domain-containing protein [Gallionella sp.]|nr:EAL domain-containing protein [Gallionella sp.]
MMEPTEKDTMEMADQIEQALRISEVAFETSDAIMITDADCYIVRVNQAFMDITGYSSGEVVGKNARMLNSGQHDKIFYAEIEMWQKLFQDGSWTGEISDKRKNGEVYPKWMKISAVKNRQQQNTHYVAIFNDLSERESREEEIRNLASYDKLTRLPNRNLFLDLFSEKLANSTRPNNFGALLLIDLDRFKILNDTLGHDCGDLLLIEVAARLKDCVRGMDTLARLGADEFIMLIEDVGDNADETSRRVGMVAEKIRECLSRPYFCNGLPLSSSSSIGISLYCGDEIPGNILVQHAEMAMYQAKDAGRNSIRFFDPIMQDKVAAHAKLENDLRQAISRSQFHLHYQMQVDNSHRPVGAEALLRWDHPERGVVLPGVFIPIAEESRLILEIGDWVMDNACKQLALWSQSEQTRKLTLAVNVSAKQFAIDGFVDSVANVLKAHQVDPTRLKLELTESVMLEDMDGTVEKMHALKALGVGLSIDDFGIGYSSLSYLKQLPLDQLKIDQSFVQGITKDGSDAMLVQTIIDLAANFHMNVIAEGVETEAQLTFLKHHECMVFQGFLFGMALPVYEFEKSLHRIVKELTGSFRAFKPAC